MSDKLKVLIGELHEVKNILKIEDKIYYFTNPHDQKVARKILFDLVDNIGGIEMDYNYPTDLYKIMRVEGKPVSDNINEIYLNTRYQPNEKGKD